MLANQIVLIRGERIAEVGPSVAIPAGATVIDLGQATRDARHDRRPCPREHRRREPRDAGDHRARQRPDRPRGGLHHRGRHGFARRLLHGRAARRHQQRPRPGTADAGGRPVAQSARHAVLRRRPDVALLRRLRREQEHQRAVARPRRRARGEASRRRLHQDLHDPGLRRHHSHVESRCDARQQPLAVVRGGRCDRRRGAPARPQGRLPRLWRRGHGQLHQGGRRRAQSPAQPRRQGRQDPARKEADLRADRRRSRRARGARSARDQRPQLAAQAPRAGFQEGARRRRDDRVRLRRHLARDPARQAGATSSPIMRSGG